MVRFSVDFIECNSGIGDFNDDGYPDLLIGAPSVVDGGEGMAYIVFGGLRTTDLYMNQFSSSDGIIISSGTTGDACGFSVSAVGGECCLHFGFWIKIFSQISIRIIFQMLLLDVRT